jgi:hypothetical protein
MASLTRGVPVGLGSGRAKLQNKVQAFLHSTRLVTESWPDACILMNNIFSFTGDLGTESRFGTFVGSSTRLMGDWINLAPGAEDEAADDEVYTPRDIFGDIGDT